MALAITALVIVGGVAMAGQWSTSALPVAGARQASDAQVQQMIGELRNAIGVSYISPNEVIALVNTNGATGVTPTVNGTSTGPYYVAYYF